MIAQSSSPRPASEEPRAVPVRDVLIAVAVAVGLTWIFWGPLWEGGSLIGGDLFPYFFPQKVFLAEQLQSGVIPLWNPLTGHGYPTIAESQTGVCYPPDLLAYRWLSVTTAYNVVQLFHYVFGFLGVWLLARRLGCTNSGALLAGLSFIYGWCAPRICLEWAVITAAYLPWMLWCAESYLQRPRTRWLIALCVLSALQLFAGHFHIAFLTQLALMIYAPLRGWIRVKVDRNPSLTVGAADETWNRPQWLLVWAAIFISFPLAAVQLAPTWELKQRSQRSVVSQEHQPGYGHLPPQYWLQAVAPWIWYAGDIDATLAKLPNYAGGAGTNKVEAHLYFGFLPLVLAVGGWAMSWRSRSETDRVLRLWMLLGLAFLLYAPGWFLPATQHLPGFSFFRGPGRYGIITSLAVALAAGLTFSRWLARCAGSAKIVIVLTVLTVTTAELWWIAQIGYSVLLEHPVVERRVDSPIRKLLAQEPQPVRLFAPMANVANLLDVSATPVYLGIGPQEYFDPQYTMPVGPQGGLNLAGDEAQILWLQQAGVTHIFSLDRLNLKNWPADLQWTGIDPFLHAAFGRGNEPVYLYRLRHSRGRIAWEDAPATDASVEIVKATAHQVQARCDSIRGGKIVLTELAYPGWEVTVDGQLAVAEASGMFRAVTVGPGPHDIVWSYRPASVYWGSLVSGFTAVLLLGGVIATSRRKSPSSNAKRLIPNA